MTFDIKVGQTVYLQPVGNNARGWDGELLESQIEKIGREYFYVTLHGWQKAKFRKSDFFDMDRNQHNGGFVVYESPAMYEAQKEVYRRYDAIRKYFHDWSHKPPADVTNAIYELMDDAGLF